MKLPLRALIIGTLFTIVFSYMAVVATSRFNMYVPASQISAISIIFCVLLILIINPILGKIKVSVLNRQEMFLIFIMATVPAGLASFGFVGNSIPFIATMNNPRWNTPQAQLDANVNPVVDPDMFLGSPLFEFRDVKDWQKFSSDILAGENNPVSPAGRICKYLTEDTKDLFSKVKDGTEPTFKEQVALGLAVKNVLAKADFYDAEAFKGVKIPEEAERLIAQKINLLDQTYEVPVLNRLLMEAAFSDTVGSNNFVSGMEAIKYYNRGMRAAGKEAFPVFIKRDTDSFGEYLSGIGRYIAGNKDNRKLMGDIPWGAWLRPLIYWGLLGAVLIVFFYALNEIVFKQWYENEKLVFPIAELASTVLGPDEKSGSTIPPVFKNALFWVGFSIAFLLIFYNGMVNAKWFDGLSAIDLTGKMSEKLEGTAFEGITPGFRLEIFFVCIGLAFLLPTEFSFSAWFFFLFMRLQQLIAVWLGHGVNSNSFPTNWFDKSNFMTAQGGGAMEVFGFVCLWKVRHKLFAFFYKLARPNGTEKISKDVIKEYSKPSLLFFIATILIFYFLRRGDVSWGMCFLTYFATLFLTIAMVRLVAECGIIGFQMNWGAIHMLKTFGLYRITWLFNTRGVGTVIYYLGGMFVELKTFIAPTMMNGKFLAAKSKIPNKYFSLSLILGIGAAFVVCALTIVALASDQGVSAMNRWFFISLPTVAFNGIKDISAAVETSLQQGDSWFTDHAPWFGIGGVTCALILYMRQFYFWIPHHIGLMMFLNHKMKAYWFSFFIAWIFKKAAVKYCDPDGYKFIRGFFIGLIIGECLAIAIATVLAIAGYDNMGLTLNRN
ncbi:MAG: DUF6785 family protein [Planctomycetota bacterium]|jgi:hypothetical protein